MEWISLDAGEVSEHSSLGLYMSEAARIKGANEFRVHIASVSPGGLLGRHPARLWQLFHVISGSGWVSGDDGQRHGIQAGQSVRWSPGESHESGSDTGMLAAIVQADVPPPNGLYPP
jgi:quercetin dioxygenase-like cupin family protein